MTGRQRRRACWVVLVLLAAGLLASAGPVPGAGALVDQAAAALRRDPLYVHPAAERQIGEEEQQRLRNRLNQGGRPVFVAILPGAAADEAGGDPGALPGLLGKAVGIRGTYAVVAGNSFRAASDDLPSGVATNLATSVFRENRERGTAAVLEAFVERVQRLPTESRSPTGGTPPAPGEGADGESDGSSALPLLLVGAGGAGGLWLWRRRRREQAELAQYLSGARESLRAELQVLADDVMTLEPQVAVHPDARPDYDAAVSRFRWAEAAVPAIDSADDVPRVQRALTEASYAMARVRARVQGYDPPPPPPELRTEGPHREPAVVIDERGEPAYAGYDGGWGGGGFFGGNNLFAGILLGQMLGGFGGWSHGGDHGRGGDQGGDDGGGFWRSGGDDSGGGFGDLGGGDFGGGDFGGGDSGGGDW